MWWCVRVATTTHCRAGRRVAVLGGGRCVTQQRWEPARPPSTTIGRLQKPSIGKTKIPYRTPYSDYKLAIASREIAIGERNSYSYYYFPIVGPIGKYSPIGE